MTNIQNAAQVKALVGEAGLEFRLVDNAYAAIEAGRAPRSKEVAYYFDLRRLPELVARRYTNDNMGVNGVVMVAGNCRNVCYGATSHVALRKFLNSDADEAMCDICMDDTRRGMAHLGVLCAVCAYRMCQICFLKLTLTEVNVLKIRSMQPPKVFKCPQCRKYTSFNIWQLYIKAMKHLDAFSPSQRDALLFLSKRDADFQQKMHDREYRIKMMQQRRMKTLNQTFRTGALVTIQGLVNKSVWNGLRAVVIGKVIVKNGAFRYPVKLQNSKHKALVKKENLQLVKSIE